VATHVFLLRGIGPPTHRVMTLAALAQARVAAGLPGTHSVLATGNMLVPSDAPGDAVEATVPGCMRAVRAAVLQRRSGEEPADATPRATPASVPASRRRGEDCGAGRAP
jgi:hypothetical protein